MELSPRYCLSDFSRSPSSSWKATCENVSVQISLRPLISLSVRSTLRVFPDKSQRRWERCPLLSGAEKFSFRLTDLMTAFTHIRLSSEVLKDCCFNLQLVPDQESSGKVDRFWCSGSWASNLNFSRRSFLPESSSMAPEWKWARCFETSLNKQRIIVFYVIFSEFSFSCSLETGPFPRESSEGFYTHSSVKRSNGLPLIFTRKSEWVTRHWRSKTEIKTREASPESIPASSFQTIRGKQSTWSRDIEWEDRVRWETPILTAFMYELVRLHPPLFNIECSENLLTSTYILTCVSMTNVESLKTVSK